MRTKSLALAATSLTVLLGVSPALAQNNQCPPGTSGPNCNAVETVTVTGTRIPTPASQSANPIISVGATEIQDSGVLNLTDYLRRVPALTGSLSQYLTSSPAGLITNFGSSLEALNLLDLRNLGFDRTLVLEDGQRLVSSSPGDAAVDTSTIPITLIDRVDIVTAGSSAVYGADGVSGVVNFVMKHDLEGISARIQGSQPQDGGDNSYLAAVSIGHNFDNDHGNVEFTVENAYQNALSFTQRSFTKPGGAAFLVTNPANAFDLTNAPLDIESRNATIFLFSSNAAIISNPFSGPVANGLPVPDFLGSGKPFVLGPGVNTTGGDQGTGDITMGGDGLPLAAASFADLAPLTHRTNIQLDGDDEFSHWFKLSGEFRYSHVDTKTIEEPAFNEFATVTSDNPFLPANVQSAILANPVPNICGPGCSAGLFSSFPYTATFLDGIDRASRNTYRGVVGAEGDLPAPDFVHDARYNIHYVYGQTDVNDVDEHNVAEDRYYAALDSVAGPGGPTCRSNLDPSAVPFSLESPTFDAAIGVPQSFFGTTFTPGPNSGCVAFNPFQPNSAQNRAAANFFEMNTPNLSLLRQQDLNGYINFDFPQFSDWGWTAKPVAFVLGAEWREEFSKSTSDPITRLQQVQGAPPGTLQSDFFGAGFNPSQGRFEVKEAFGEISVPLVVGKPFVNELTFDFAGRVSDYSTSGTDETWKVDARYSPIAGLTFRGTDAYAVRAPNIGELFGPQVRGFENVNDPCDPGNINAGTQFRAANCVAIFNALGVPFLPGFTNPQSNFTVPNFISGNPNLQPEVARTLTLGAVVQPEWIPNLQVTADFYRVTIADAITPLSGSAIADFCVDASTIVNPFCAAVTRTANASPPGSITSEIAAELNVAALATQGTDFTIDYSTDLDDLFQEHVGSLRFHLVGNHMDYLTTTPFAGQAPQNFANVINGGADGGPAPFWQAFLDIVWHRDDFTVDYNIQWADALLNFNRDTVANLPNVAPSKFIHTPPQDIHGVQVRYEVRDGMQVYAGINNLWYQKPSANDIANAYPADPTGRVFYLGVNIDVDPLQ